MFNGLKEQCPGYNYVSKTTTFCIPWIQTNRTFWYKVHETASKIWDTNFDFRHKHDKANCIYRMFAMKVFFSEPQNLLIFCVLSKLSCTQLSFVWWCRLHSARQCRVVASATCVLFDTPMALNRGTWGTQHCRQVLITVVHEKLIFIVFKYEQQPRVWSLCIFHDFSTMTFYMEEALCWLSRD